MVVSSCQQRLRIIAAKARREERNVVVKDLSDLVFEAMGQARGEFSRRVAKTQGNL
jgi:hypothetical protein